MTRLSRYINEWENIETTNEVFVKFINENCKKSIDAYNNETAQIYRGISTLREPTMLTDPAAGEKRKSRNAEGNFYTVIFDSLPSWKKMPKRSRSIICSTSLSDAMERSVRHPYIVLPVDGAKIAVASNIDIWISFPHAGIDEWKGADLNNLNIWLQKNGFKDNSTLNTKLKGITKTKVYRDDLGKREPKKFRKFLINWYDSGMTFYDYLNDVMDPAKNGITLVTAGSSIPKDREVWTSSRCAMIQYSERKKYGLK